ncbi:GIP, partial [Symbiodinium pilosum]
VNDEIGIIYSDNAPELKDVDDQGGEPPKPEDPKSLPKGSAEGYNWDGVRLVRNKKGSKRPPDTPSEFWHMYSAKQREEDIARYQRKVELEEERLRKEREAEAPAMPVVHGELSQEHRERIALLFWDKLAEVAEQQLALVARLVSQSEVERTPDAKAAMDKEWKKLVDKACWLTKKAREYKDVIREHQAQGTKAHFGRIFEICSQKGSELPDGDPNKKWKGRSVFQGNRVSDENNDHAIFSELGSSPASMEAGKIIDVFGSQPGYSKQQGDAKQAYTQALFDGVETWVRLPRNRWPKEWDGMNDPVCPLRLALYGHPDSRGLWERHCQQELEKVGWTAVLPEIWQSVFYHAELDLLLVIYVDDFKMAGPEGNLDKGWETINSVIDMDPAELFGRYFGCNHHEQRQVMLSRDDHPFAYVFDKKTNAAAGLAAEPSRTEDYWEIDLELGAAVKHHVYPRKRLYVPTMEDSKNFPGIGSDRITVPDSGEQIEDVVHDNVGAKRKEWWVGSTYFPLVENPDFAQSVAAAAAKKKSKGARSKTEAKREAKQERFKDPSTIEPEVIPAMTKLVNIMTYDMRDFLSSCVDRYCELAGVQRSTLKHVATPFHENRIAKPAAEDEPQGQLQPIASKVLMKILFAARMARWDLLRATQGLASRVTKWSRDCDVAFHRLEPIPILTKFDPELDEIRYGGDANGRSVANLNSLNVHLSPKFKVQL